MIAYLFIGVVVSFLQEINLQKVLKMANKLGYLEGRVFKSTLSSFLGGVLLWPATVSFLLPFIGYYLWNKNGR